MFLNKNNSGFIGLALLAVVTLGLLIVAAGYVYKVRSGQAHPLGQSLVGGLR